MDRAKKAEVVVEMQKTLGETESIVVARNTGLTAGQVFIAECDTPRCVVGHAGWISAATWLKHRRQDAPSAQSWPAAVRYSTCTRFDGGSLRPKSHSAAT